MNQIFSQTIRRSLHHASRPLIFKARNNFGVFASVRSSITSGSVYRAIAILASIQIISTYAASYLIDRGLIMSVQDYLENAFVKENQKFQIAGIVKPGSIQVKRGTLEMKFILTDFDRDIEVFYRGTTKFEFKEGETLVLSGYLPDKKNKNKIIGMEYMTKHSMDGYNWENKVAVPRENFGVNTRTQTI